MSPFARFDRLDPERREKILGAALDEFVANGYEGASINQIIAAAEISKGSFYYYFEDKADLFTAVIEDTIDVESFMHASGFVEAEDGISFWSAMQVAAESSLSMLSERPEVLRLSEEVVRLPEHVLTSAQFANFYTKMMEYLTMIIEKGQRIGAVRDDLPLPVLIELWTTNERVLNTWFLARWRDMDEAERDACTATYLSMFKRIFSP